MTLPVHAMMQWEIKYPKGSVRKFYDTARSLKNEERVN